MSEEEPRKEEKLSAKENSFVDAYLHGPSRFDATKSARVAGYKDNENLHTNANKILQKTTVSAEIERRLHEVKLSKGAVLAGLADIANGDAADFMEITPTGWNVSLLLHDENGDLVRDEQGRPIRNPKTKLIKKLKQKVTTILAKSEDGEDREIIETELELYSAHEAYRDMGKHYGLLKDTVEHTGKDGGPLILPPIEKTNDQLSDALAKLAQIAGSLALSSGAGIPRDAGGPADGDTSSEESG